MKLKPKEIRYRNEIAFSNIHSVKKNDAFIPSREVFLDLEIGFKVFSFTLSVKNPTDSSLSS